MIYCTVLPYHYFPLMKILKNKKTKSQNDYSIILPANVLTSVYFVFFLQSENTAYKNSVGPFISAQGHLE